MCLILGWVRAVAARVRSKDRARAEAVVTRNTWGAYPTPTSPQQRGAVAIVVALSMTLLLGMLGLVLDLGHLYVAKSELQNAADAAALSGARELNGTVAGLNLALSRAVEAAGKNKYDLSSLAVAIDSSHVRFSNTADGPWADIAQAQLDASNKAYIKVDTDHRSLNAWFIQVLATSGILPQTFGMAVAGKYTVNMTPLAICQLPDPGTTHEFGYERGLAYKISEANPVGPGTMYWIDPLASAPGVCQITNTNETRPYVCTGKMPFNPMLQVTVNTNTGISSAQLEALDSRFDYYGSQGKCDPVSAPPDTNVRQYAWDDPAAGAPSQWMLTDPTRQSLKFVNSSNGPCGRGSPCKPKPYSLRTATDHGVMWTAYRPAAATTAQWPSLYAGNSASAYPETSPYAQTSGPYFRAPTAAHAPGQARRRELTMAIVDCSAAGGVCRPVPVLGFGKFMLQRRANLSGDKEIHVEFGGLITGPVPSGDVRLYR